MNSATLLHRIQQSGVTLTVEADNLIVDSTEPLSEPQCAFIRQYKPAILQALRRPVATVDDRQGETVSRGPWVQADPGAMAAGVRHRLYAPNCNRCRQYRWRSATCQQQGRVAFANTPPCGGQDYQPFVLTLAEREAVAGTTKEGLS